MEQNQNQQLITTPAEEVLFTIDEVAKWCGLSRNATYMHYKRGHIQSQNQIGGLECHRLYFSREQVEQFRAKYIVL